MILFIFIASLPAGDGPFRGVGDAHGIHVEAQKVKDASLENVRASTHSTATIEALDAVIWSRTPERKESHAPDVALREILLNREDERIFYEIVRTPIVSDRDYVIHLRRLRDPQTRVVQIVFESIEDPRKPPQPGNVRIPRIAGMCTLEPADNGTDLTYVVYSEPGGSLPGWMAKSAERDNAAAWVREMLRRAGDVR